MARVDDVVFNYLHLPKNAVQNDCIKGALEDAVRYGFQQGESFGKYVKYADKVEGEMFRELSQAADPKRRQMVIRTDYDYQPRELETALKEGWKVVHVTQMGMGRSKLEYILEKTGNLGNSETVKNPEE